MRVDIVIIGGGVIGTAIAWKLARYELDIVLLEKEDDVAMGTSKANSGIIHAGYNATSDTLKGKLNVKANPMFDEICRDLKVPFKRIGSLVIGFNEEDKEVLLAEKENGERMGIKGLEMIETDRLFELEPNLNPEAECALYAPTAGIISPYEFVIALANNAAINGVNILLNTEVMNLELNSNKIASVITNKGRIKTKIVINAAGLFADKIARMAGDSSFSIRPRKGEYHLFDKKCGDKVKHVLFPIPGKHSKGILVTPTVHGNLMIGPNANFIEDKSNLAVTEKGLEEVYKGAVKLVPGISRKEVIKSFSGLRAVENDGDFIIGPSSTVKGLINAAGIQSPGLTSAPAIAKLVRDIVLQEYTEIFSSVSITINKDFQKKLSNPNSLSTFLEEERYEEWKDHVINNPDYGEVICRCEMVTKGEILKAIHQPVPARSIDAVKRRTRAGGGRCQGGFCGPRVLQIISEELGISPLDVNKKGVGSENLTAKAKEFLFKDGDDNERI